MNLIELGTLVLTLARRRVTVQNLQIQLIGFVR